MKRVIYDWVSSDFYESISAKKLESLIKSGLRSIESASIYGQFSRTQMLMNTARGIASLKYPLMNMDNQFYVNEIKNYRENCDIESVAVEIRRGHLIPTDYLKVFESIFSQDELPVIFSENEKRFNRFMTQIPTKGKNIKIILLIIPLMILF